MESKRHFLEFLKNYPHIDAEVVSRAYDLAEKAHAGQKRDCGEPYITHPVEVAKLLCEIGMDTPTIAAALLHDVVEDTPVSLEDVRKAFGGEIAFFVDGVTKLEKLPTSGESAKTETLRKMFMATAEDIRVALIKLADRIHNMRTLAGCAPEKRAKLSQETMDVYAPLAGRLGMGEWKGILEDLAFPYLYPKEYEWLMQRAGKAYEEHQRYIEKIVPLVREHLVAEHLELVELHARPKHHWSLYQKLLAHDMDFEEIYDLMALRIIVRTVEECYRALGVIHKHYTPLPGKVKDYIALPKGSGYKSLHTTVFCVDGRITEFQARTPEMHQEAEFGIAAHWRYKEPGAKKLKWIEQMQEWQKAARGSKEFLEALRLDFLKSRIFVFTPKGDIIDLPRGASAVDFAYAIHTEIGHRCAGAKADGRIIPLAQKLENGMLVEIMTRKDPQPSRDWLTFVQTPEARKKISAWFKTPPEESRGGAARGTEDTTPQQQRFVPVLGRPGIAPVALTAKGMQGVLLRLAKCCSPLPGDDVAGYVAVQGGITVHKISCANLKKARDARRRIPVTWHADNAARHPMTLKISGRSRVGMLRDITEAISKRGLNILSLTAFDTPEGEATLVITVEVKDAAEADELAAKLKNVKNVSVVERV